jgi:hypothetical protein
VRIHWFFLIYFLWSAQFVFGQPKVDPDSIRLDPRAAEGYNPFGALYSMNSWTKPVLDHVGKSHKDGDMIQIIADGGNGVQDPPNPDGSPGGDDMPADGNFNVQFVNGAKHSLDGLEPGMFMGMCYFIPYELQHAVYLRVWEGADPSVSGYYEDSEEYVTYLGDRGGAMIQLQTGVLDNIDWRFGASKRVREKK